MPNLVVFYITILVLISLISDGDFGQWFRTVWCIKKTYRVLSYMTIPVLISIISDGDFGRYYAIRKPNTVTCIGIFFQILMHIILKIQKYADNGHTFMAKRQVHSRNCGQDNGSTIFERMKIIDNTFFYYNYHFHDPSTLLTEKNTIIII